MFEFAYEVLAAGGNLSPCRYYQESNSRCRVPSMAASRFPGATPLGWAAHTSFWTLGTGTSIWLVGDTPAKYPPVGSDLRILLIDGAVVECLVVRASPSEIVIELDGYRRPMTPAAPGLLGRTRRFPGSEWILGKPVLDRA